MIACIRTYVYLYIPVGITTIMLPAGQNVSDSNTVVPKQSKLLRCIPVFVIREVVHLNVMVDMRSIMQS